VQAVRSAPQAQGVVTCPTAGAKANIVQRCASVATGQPLAPASATVLLQGASAELYVGQVNTNNRSVGHRQANGIWSDTRTLGDIARLIDGQPALLAVGNFLAGMGVCAQPAQFHLYPLTILRSEAGWCQSTDFALQRLAAVVQLGGPATASLTVTFTLSRPVRVFACVPRKRCPSVEKT
jgi:hypothetical protein